MVNPIIGPLGEDLLYKYVNYGDKFYYINCISDNWLITTRGPGDLLYQLLSFDSWLHACHQRPIANYSRWSPWSPWWWCSRWWSMKREVMYFSFMWPSHSNCLLFNWLIRCLHVTLTLKRVNFFSTSVPEITLIKRNEYSIIALRQGTVCAGLSVSKSFVSESVSHS